MAQRENRFHFTKSKLLAVAQPEPKQGKNGGERVVRSLVYDTEVPKLACAISSGGSRVLYVIKRMAGSVEWVKVGNLEDVTPEHARKAAQRILGEFASGTNPAELRRQERAQQTLGEAFNNYFEQHVTPQGLKRSEDIRAMWERLLGTLPDVPAKKHGRKRVKHAAGVDWSSRKLDSIDNAEVRKLHADVGRTHRTYANRVVELISTIYGRAIEWGYKGENPAKGIKPFKETKRARFLNQSDTDELPRFFAALANDSSADFRHFICLALTTGARRENLLGLRWQDINLQSATWTIPAEVAKENEDIVIPLVPQAIEVLRERNPKTEGYVFPAKSRTGHIVAPKKRWKALLTRAKVSDLRIHDLRRSLGSWQAISGASLPVIGKSLGHRSASATQIYARLHLDPVRASVGAATSAMWEAAGVKQPEKVKRASGKPRRSARAR